MRLSWVTYFCRLLNPSNSMIFMVTSHLQRSQSWKNGKGLLLYPVPKPVLLHVLCPRPHHSLPESFYEYTFAQVWMGGGGSLEMYQYSSAFTSSASSWSRDGRWDPVWSQPCSRCLVEAMMSFRIGVPGAWVNSLEIILRLRSVTPCGLNFRPFEKKIVPLSTSYHEV